VWALGAIFLASAFAAPFVEYKVGRGPLWLLLTRIEGAATIGIFVAFAIVFVLRWTGAIPRIEDNSAPAQLAAFRLGLVRFPNPLAILIAALLAACFIAAPLLIDDQRLVKAMTNVFPLVLLLIVWIAIMLRWRKKR